MPVAPVTGDPWAHWLDSRRDAGDAGIRERHAPLLASLRDGLRGQARRIAVLGVAAQADSDPDSAQALGQLTDYGNAALNELLQPSGTTISSDEYALLTGPVLARIFFERRPVTDEFIAAVVAQWLAGPARTIASQDVPPPNE